MSRTTQHPKESSFNFRIDPALKAAFTHAADAADTPAAQLLRDFMRDFVRRREDMAFEAEARRQSLAAAEQMRDAKSDAHAALQESEALFDADHFADVWKA